MPDTAAKMAALPKRHFHANRGSFPCTVYRLAPFSLIPNPPLPQPQTMSAKAEAVRPLASLDEFNRAISPQPRITRAVARPFHFLGAHAAVADVFGPAF